MKNTNFYFGLRPKQPGSQISIIMKIVVFLLFLGKAPRQESKSSKERNYIYIAVQKNLLENIHNFCFYEEEEKL